MRLEGRSAGRDLDGAAGPGGSSSIEPGRVGVARAVCPRVCGQSGEQGWGYFKLARGPAVQMHGALEVGLRLQPAPDPFLLAISTVAL